jgi:Na+-transporting methylmalonyl-CoA/oxaloacetate decarboxylase gamma subunit
MNSELLRQGLMIAAIGMGLVFVVIIFLWGLMALLMRLTSGNETLQAKDAARKATDKSQASEVEQTERRRRAAAAAVSVGLALASLAGRPVAAREGRKDALSPWQAFHRSRSAVPNERRGS